MTEADVSSGLVLPYVAQAVAGKAGAGALLVTIFMVFTHSPARHSTPELPLGYISDWTCTKRA